MAILNARLPRVRYASRAPEGPPKKATNPTARPSAMNATTNATTVMRAASYPSTGTMGLCGVRRFPPRALPAAERCEDLAEAGQLLVLCGALLVVDHEQPLGPRACGLGDLADRIADSVG